MARLNLNCAKNGFIRPNLLTRKRNRMETLRLISLLSIRQSAFIGLLVFSVIPGMSVISGCGNDSGHPPKQTSSSDSSTTKTVARDTSTIILVADVWPPYNCTPQDNNEGYMVDVAREIFEPLGYKVDYNIVPWPRALAGTLEGSYDGAIGCSRSEGPELVFPDQELVLTSVAFFTLADNPWQFAGEASLNNVRLGVAKVYDYVDWLDAYIVREADGHDKVQAVTGYRPLEQNIRKLVNKEIDVLVGNGDTVKYESRQLGLADKIKKAGNDPYRMPCFIAFSPNTPSGSRLAAELDEGMRRLRSTGRFAEILAAYGLTDWAPTGQE